MTGKNEFGFVWWQGPAAGKSWRAARSEAKLNGRAMDHLEVRALRPYQQNRIRYSDTDTLMSHQWAAGEMPCSRLG